MPVQAASSAVKRIPIEVDVAVAADGDERRRRPGRPRTRRRPRRRACCSGFATGLRADGVAAEREAQQDQEERREARGRPTRVSAARMLSAAARDEPARGRSRHLGPRRRASQGHAPAVGPRRPAPNGSGRPSLPGLRMPFGSRAALIATQRRRRPGRAPRRTKRARLSPTPWWWLSAPPVAEHGTGAGVPGGDVVGVALVGLHLAGEREVEAAAGLVGVRLVGRDGERARHGLRSRRSRRRRCRGAPPRARRPPSCRRRSPGRSAPRARRRRCASPIQWSTRPSSSRSGVLALLGHDLHAGVDHRAVALVEDEQHVDAVARSRGCAATRPRRRGAARPASRPAAVIRRMASRPSANDGEAVRRVASCGRARVGLEPGPGDDAERALGPDEQLVEVGADGLAGLPAGADDAAVGQDDLEADDDVLDLAVAVRQLAGAAAGEPAADGGQRHRLRPVAHGEPCVAAAARPRSGRRTCRPAPRRPARPGRPTTMPDRPQRSSTTPPCTGTAPPTTLLRPPRGGDRDAGLVAAREHAGDLARSTWGGRPRTAGRRPGPSVAQTMASGHQSRLASAERRPGRS